ncbi:hypothetical protein G7K_6251-t1 [Saitoella complicata NRRL Y-17804]|uniref:Uncharacterized protein n=1 Tax=Saitoella complicata (strain BCRC 22490 / CBS 7301 / JCM 7358 / NBRC 10748 / NRRL Y-17804) TaxID=698492 RepID=A0A0E9NQL0_SAICN|nr:hypothetical protein G7K_6251-t1 [Saitoella complicata NRRL Y-17804]
MGKVWITKSNQNPTPIAQRKTPSQIFANRPHDTELSQDLARGTAYCTPTKPRSRSLHLTVTTEGEGVVLLPDVTTSRLGVVETVTLVDTTGLLANGSKTTGLTVLVNSVRDPVDTRVTTNSFVRGINTDDLKVLVGGIRVDPVRVQDAQVRATAADALLGGGAEGALVFELVDTLVGGLTVGGTLGGGALATTAADADTVDDVSLLGLVTETAGLVGAGRTGSTVADRQLAVLPAADTEKEAVRPIVLGGKGRREGEEVHTGGHRSASSCRALPSTCRHPNHTKNISAQIPFTRSNEDGPQSKSNRQSRSCFEEKMIVRG